MTGRGIWDHFPNALERNPRIHLREPSREPSRGIFLRKNFQHHFAKCPSSGVSTESGEAQSVWSVGKCLDFHSNHGHPGLELESRTPPELPHFQWTRNHTNQLSRQPRTVRGKNIRRTNIRGFLFTREFRVFQQPARNPARSHRGLFRRLLSNRIASSFVD